MKKLLFLGMGIFSIIFVFNGFCGSFSQTYAHQVKVQANTTETFYIWREVSSQPFNELIVSWNALRPVVGTYTFFVRIKTKKLSGWLKYAEWGATRQHSFLYTKDEIAQSNIVTVTPKGGGLATEFEIKVEASGGADLANVHKLYACASNTQKYVSVKPAGSLESGFIEKVPQQSQMVLKHPRAKDMCSPTATSTVISYFLGKRVDPLDFAALVLDSGHNIYGNWPLNGAQVYDISDGKVFCWVERLASFDELHSYLRRDCPVVVSIQGPIKGSASPYQNGHLIVVIGWDAKNKRVLCVDSAFKANNLTMVWYDSDEFCKAWGRHKNLSYVFMPLG